MDFFSILTLLGGLAMFLYGMQVMGDGLAKVSGGKLEQILENLLGDLGVEFTDTIETRFHCNCSKERVSKAIISIGKKELQNMIDDGEVIEVNCHFCNSHYNFSVEELEEMLKAAR